MPKSDVQVMSGKTDEREQGTWKTRYDDKKVITFHVIEAIYLLIMVIISFVLLLLNYMGKFNTWFGIEGNEALLFSRMVSCVACGLLGGTIFDIKWFYKSIAHGYWNADRIYWRLFTPIISLSFAFCLACIFSDNIIVYGSGFTASTLGFLTGYFSDEAVGKMAEVAKVLFNTNKKETDKKVAPLIIVLREGTDEKKTDEASVEYNEDKE